MKLEPPIRQYLLGKYPTHSSFKNLANNFENLHPNALKYVLFSKGIINDNMKPTRKAFDDSYVDVCERKVLWNVSKIQELFQKDGTVLNRVFMNQEYPNFSEDPGYANLGTIGTYFNVTANQVGKWLDELGLRENKEPTKDSLQRGLAKQFEMKTVNKKTRTVTQWSVTQLLSILHENGHQFDFDYKKSIEGSGKNSNVKVQNLDDTAREFAKTFVKMFKKVETRKNCDDLVSKTSFVIQKKAEMLLNKPGFITNKEYRKY